MSESTFLREVPDLKDIENRTGECPGYSVCILKDDTFVGISLTPIADDDPMKIAGIALSRENANAFLAGLQKAIGSLKEE
ncbi:hypothetical protein ACFLS1_06225 [Verrucomicrobiota bacterium]